MKQTEFTIAELQEMYEEYLLTMLNSTNGISKEDLMTDQDVAELFGVSVKTLDTYRRNGEIKFFKLGGRNYYLRSLLLLDILKKYND